MERSGWRRRLYEIIFEAETPSGKGFDVILIISIVLSVITVMLDSVTAVSETYGGILTSLEWFFTLLFSVEYILRLLCVGKPLRYASSFFGIVDLVAVLPTYITLLMPGTHYFLVIRVLRVLRIFRVLKLVEYLNEATLLLKALRASRHKIAVFLFAVITLVIILGAMMYLIEDQESGFTSIPKCVYWAIVTLTTVGYGDISPQTPPGQALAAMIMILGYSIIAVPTGIVTVEYSRTLFREVSSRSCPECGREGHDIDARHCKYCGSGI